MKGMLQDPLSLIYSPSNRSRLLVFAGILFIAIAVVDWRIEPYISLGFLYLFPIMIVGGFLSRATIVGLALVCAILDFVQFPKDETLVHLLFSSAGFVGTGLFISELMRNRRIVVRRHLDALGDQMKLRREAEEQLQVLVESSPAAIVTIDLNGTILLANDAAHHLLLGEDSMPLQGQQVSCYLPALRTVVQTQASRQFRTALQCRGQRSNGEVFLAGIWFSTYSALSGPRLAAIVVDLSEDLRNREDLSLNHLLKNSRILMAAVAHEVRNLCGAMMVVHKNLSRIPDLEHNEDFHALNTLIGSLEKVTALELRTPTAQDADWVELTSLLDEFRVLIDTAYRESEMEIEWQIPASLPLVWADRYGLVQVFLNLAKNSQRAMQKTIAKRLRVSVVEEGKSVIIRFEDTGVGIASPDKLFRPFHSGSDSTGLGLYMSRAIMRSFGGELVYEKRDRGCCFAMITHSFREAEEPAHA
jgi:two-component system sensor kinase FixL